MAASRSPRAGPALGVGAIMGAGVGVGVVALLVMGAGTALAGMAAPTTEGSASASLADVLFYVIAGVVCASGAGVAFSRSILYSALSLLGALLGVGALFLYLRADYVAVTQLLIYVGGVLVLILFAVMLTSRIGEDAQSNPPMGALSGVLLLGATVAVVGWVAVRAPWRQALARGSEETTAARIGDLFLGEFLLPFEVISVLLLAALVGAVVVARKEVKE